MVGLTAKSAVHIGGALRSQSAARNAVSSASTKIEREISAQRILLAVITPNNNYRRQVTLGLAYALRSAGYTPEISSSWAFQIGPAYYNLGNPVVQATVYMPNHGVKTRVVIAGGVRHGTA
jgi:hypothetical protein